MTYEEFLNVSHRERADTIRKLGFRRPAVIEMKIQCSIMDCMDDIEKACRDLPVAERYKGSNNSQEVLDPSQRFSELRQELQRLYKYLLRKERGGRGLWPTMPVFVGHDALCALLGEGPFGDKLIVATKMDFEPIGRSKTKIRVKTITVVEWDFYSHDPSIRSEQFKKFSRLYAEDAVSWRSLAKDWPPELFECVQQARRINPHCNLPLERFVEAIGDEKEKAIANIGLALSMIEYFIKRIDIGAPIHEPDGTRCRARGRSCGGARKKKANKHASQVNKMKRKTTITDWSRSDPGFALASSIINCVSPISRGVPSFNTLGHRRAAGRRSQRELIAELICNVVKLVQRHIDSSQDLKGPEFNSVCRQNTFLGSGRAMVAKSGALVALILALRTQLVAYWIARSTMFEICGVGRTSGDEDVAAAADCVIATVITSLDRLIVDRRQHLRFGTGRVRSEVGKWFGPVNPDIKRGLSREHSIVRAVFPKLVQNRAHHINLYSDLIESLNIGDDALAAWECLSKWAETGGRAKWKVRSPDPDHFNEVFEPSLSNRKVA